MTDDDALVERVGEQRSAAWRSVGDLDPYVAAHLINPAFTGGPRWPALRQAFVKVTMPDGTAVISSDGLTDPNEGTSDAGHEAEVYLVTGLADVPVGELSREAPFQFVYAVAQNIASVPASLGQALATYGMVSMGITGIGLPADWLDADGVAGVLVGVPHPTIPPSVVLETGTVAFAQVALLRPAELAAVLAGGTASRVEIGARLAALPPAALANPGRRSVV
jgi:hypothetical protein